MSKPRKKFRTAAGKTAKRPKPVKRQFITRTDARRRAERHVLKRTFKGATVQNGAALRLGIYNRGDWTNKDVWVVYKNSEETALKSSEVVLVCKSASINNIYNLDRVDLAGVGRIT
jgi:hypothetical protein